MGGSRGQSTSMMVAYVAFLVTVTQILSSEARSPLSNAIVPYDSIRRSQIEAIDVKCENGNDILVTIDFDDTFSGIVYSQGYFNDPKCRYVKAGGSARSYTFKVPYNGCGSKPSCAVCASVENILVIQSDEDLQEKWDTARKITCSRAIEDEQEKTIIFKPFVVDMLEVVNVPTKQGGVDCWMDIQRGEFPRVVPLAETIKIGETLSVLVFLRDPRTEYDLIVRDCWAFDHHDYDAKTTGRIQLSDKVGCSRKKKIFGAWKRTTETANTGATLVLHNTLQAFKFPDRMQVFLKCDVEICRGECEKQYCDEIDNAVTPATANYRTTRITTTSRPFTTTETVQSTTQVLTRGTPAVPRCYPGSRDPRCSSSGNTGTTPQITTSRPARTRPPQITTNRPARITTNRPPQTVTNRPYQTTFETPSQTTYVSSTNRPLRTQPPTQRNTIPARSTNPTKPTQSTPKPPRCGPTSRDPRCPNVTKQPATYSPPSTLPPQRPSLRSTSAPTVRASTYTAGPTYLPPLTTTQKPVTTTTLRPILTTLRPVTTTQKPVTTTAAPITTTTTRTTTPATTRTTSRVTVTAAPRCYPGSLDERCPKTTSPASPITTTTTTQRPITTTPKPNCYPGLPDPRCPQIVSTTAGPTYLPPLTTTQKPSTTTLAPITTRTTSRVTVTAAPRCYPGSLDERCPKSTTTTQKPITTTLRPITTTQRPITTTSRPITTTSRPITTTSRPITTTPKPNCYPGSSDPRCPQLRTTTAGPTYLPPLTTTQKPITTTTLRPITTTLRPITTTLRPVTTTQKPITTTLAPITTTRTTTPVTTRTTSRVTVTAAPRCYPGTLDERCPKSTTTTQKPITTTLRPITTTQRPITTTLRPITTTLTPITTTPKPNCYPGSSDPRCPQLRTTTAGPTYLPPLTTTQKPITTTTLRPITTTLRPVTTTQKPITTTLAPITTTRTTTPVTTRTTSRVTVTAAPRCYPGSLDERCPKSTTTTQKPITTTLRPITTTQRPITTTSRPITTTSRPITTTSSPITTTPKPNCYPGSSDPRCPQLRTTTAGPTYLPPLTTTQKPITTTTLRPITTTLRPVTTTQKPITTTLAPITTTRTTTPVTTRTTSRVTVTAAPRCYPGSLDERCPKSTTTTQKPITTTLKPITTTLRPITTTLRPITTTLTPITTTSRPITTTPKPNCYPGSPDPRCPQLRTTTAGPTYLPPFTTTQKPITTTTPRPVTTTLRPITTTQKPITTTTRATTPATTTSRVTVTAAPRCYPGSLDERCPKSTTTQKPITTTQRPITTTSRPITTTSRPITTTSRPITTTSKPITTTSRPITTTSRPITTTPKPNCYPGSPDPRCPQLRTTTAGPTYLPPLTDSQPKCFPGSTDVRCPRPFEPLSTTTIKPFTTTPYVKPTTPAPPKCGPGAEFDPRCPRPFVTPKTTTTTLKPTSFSLCYPGSPDPNCPTDNKPTPSFCYPGSKDPRCPPPPDGLVTLSPTTYLPPFGDSPGSRQPRNSIFNEINQLQDLDSHYIRKRDVSDGAASKEVISFSLSFKGYQLEDTN